MFKRDTLQKKNKDNSDNSDIFKTPKNQIHLEQKFRTPRFTDGHTETAGDAIPRISWGA